MDYQIKVHSESIVQTCMSLTKIALQLEPRIPD